MLKIIFIGAPITKKRPLKKSKNFFLFGVFYFKNKYSWHFQFSVSQIFWQRFIVSEILTYCWNYGPPNLLFRFFCFRLGHLSNRQTKIAENSTIYFWKLTPKQVFGESFKFFDSPTTKWRSFKFFAKLNGNHILMANFSKFRKYQTFGVIELHNGAKVS